MTVTTTTARTLHDGDGSTTSFSTGFKFDQNADIECVLRDSGGAETVWTLDTEYTLSGAGNASGGTVAVKTTPTDHTPASGETLVVRRVISETQATSVSSTFTASEVEGIGDKNAMLIQQNLDAFSRTIHVPVSDKASTLRIGNEVDRADTQLGFDSNGRPVARRIVILQDGSAGLPPLRFRDDTNTGLFSPNDDEVALTTGGTERFRVTTQALVPDGSAAAPGLAFLDDTDTGLFSPNNDEVALATGGTERLRVTTQVMVPDGTEAAPGVTLLDDSDTGLFSPGADQLAISVGGTKRFELNGSNFDLFLDGFRSFDVQGTTSSGGYTPPSRFFQNSTTEFVGEHNAILQLQTAATSNAQALLGFGTNGVIHVAGIKRGTNKFQIVVNVTGTPVEAIELDGVNGNAQFVDGSASAAGITFIGDTNTGVFRPGNDILAFSTGGSERLRIDSGGNVGIGSTPDINHELHLERSAGVVELGLVNGDNASQGIINFGDAASRTQGRITYDHANDFLAINVNNGEKLRIDSSGKLGLGTSSPNGFLHVHRSSAGAVDANLDADDFVIETSSRTGMTIFSANNDLGAIYFGDANDNAVGRITYDHSGNSMRFTTDASERMRVDNLGRLLIGHNASVTTGARAGHIQLHANGTDTGNSCAISQIMWGTASSNGAILTLAKSRGAVGTVGTAVQDNDVLGRLVFVGDDGTNITAAGAQILATVDGTPVTGKVPTEMQFLTTDTTAGILARMVIKPTGDVGIGVSSPAAKLDVDGVIKLKSYAVAGLPTAVTGGLIYVSDETGGAVPAFSDGTNWRRVTDRAVVA